MSDTMRDTDLNELAKVFAASYASPHHITFTLDGLKNLIAQAAQSQPAAPAEPGSATWKLVPVEPTEQMIEAGRHVKRMRLLDSVKAIREGRDPEELMGKTAGAEYRAMLEAAPAPPVPQTVQEITRLMMPYVDACGKFETETIPEFRCVAEAEVGEAFAPLQAALTALVEKNHELQFSLDGVNAMRRLKWQPIETAPKDGTEILLYAGPQTFEGKPVPERNTSGHWQEWEKTASEYHGTTGEYLGQSVQDGGASWMSWDGGFTEENPPTHWMPRPAAPSGNESNGGAS